MNVVFLHLKNQLSQHQQKGNNMSEQKPLDEGVSAPIKPIIKPKDSK